MIGPNSYVAGFNIGEDPKLYCKIGNYTGIGKNFYVHVSDNWGSVGNKKVVANYLFGGKFPPLSSAGISKGEPVIGNDVWIGEDVKVLTGVHIGDGAIVAAHSVVSKDVPPYAMVAGNPAQIKYFRFPADTIQKLLTIKWWDWGEDLIRDRLGSFRDIDEFLERYAK